jgi:ATP-dependent Clp protease ATP-binding subunit ClpC
MVLRGATQEAQRYNHEYVGTEHLLPSLVKSGHGIAAYVLMGHDLDLRKIRIEVEKIVQSGPDLVTIGKLPLTTQLKKVIEYAIEEAGNFNHDQAGPEHLLLGLLRDQECVAAQGLINLNIKLQAVRDEVLDQIKRNLENGGSLS